MMFCIFYLYALSYDIFKLRYPKDLRKLRSKSMRLFNHQLTQLIKSKLIHPPILLFLLINIHTSKSLSLSKFLQLTNISQPLQSLIMKHNNLIILSQHNIKLNIIRALDSSDDSLHSILRQYWTKSTMSDHLDLFTTWFLWGASLQHQGFL